jgi:hypothetical protein
MGTKQSFLQITQNPRLLYYKEGEVRNMASR